VRKALDELNQAQRLDPITPEEMAELGQVLAWRLYVEPYISKYSGKIATVKSVDDAERIVAKVGRIVQMGCFCFQSKTTAGLDLALMNPKPKVGDYVTFQMYAGEEMTLRNGRILRCLNDTELTSIVSDPDQIKGYL
jgi:co-chaperonin GroES (HSP10)